VLVRGHTAARSHRTADGPYPEAIGGVTVVDIPSHEEALPPWKRERVPLPPNVKAAVKSAACTTDFAG